MTFNKYFQNKCMSLLASLYDDIFISIFHLSYDLISQTILNSRSMVVKLSDVIALGEVNCCLSSASF